MKLRVLGTGNVFALDNTSFIVDADKKYLIDCPKELKKALKSVDLDFKDVNDVILTHLHPDHLGDLCTLVLYKHGFENKKTSLYTTQKIYNKLMTIFNNMFSWDAPAEEFVEFFKLTPNEPYEINGLEIKIRDNHHADVETIGVKLKYDNKTLAYSGDCKYNKEFIEDLHKNEKITESQKDNLLGFLWDADFIIHEADDRDDIAHTYIEDLEKLPENIKSKLYLAHFPADLETQIPKLEKNKEYII
jgi:ribonuclease BN (tRNA processing enzyme)